MSEETESHMPAIYPRQKQWRQSEGTLEQPHSPPSRPDLFLLPLLLLSVTKVLVVHNFFIIFSKNTITMSTNNIAFTAAIGALLLVTFVAYSYMGEDKSNPSPKTSWPEVVGKKGEEAVAIIESETENVNVIIVPKDAFVTTDFRVDRVRVRVDAKGIVVTTPKIG
mmetsp:Transcript_19164/g.32823  ORF Transcript_19164/g.32823 Transcript_19164/m.32823 type:complete len:166 (-) Transcript_19164:121-618(-)